MEQGKSALAELVQVSGGDVVMTHKWDYEPHQWNSTWENMPFWLRWPLAAFFILVLIFFLTAPFHPWIAR